MPWPRRLQEFSWEGDTGSRTNALGVLVCLVLGLTARSYFLARPVGEDESLTYLHFVHGGFLNGFVYWPNNHLLHTWCAKASTAIMGPGLQALRAPAFLAGVVVIPLTMLCARQLNRSSHGLVAGSVVAVCPYLLHMDTMARGYSLVNLAALVLVWFGWHLILEPDRRLARVLGVVAGIGCFVMPTFAMVAAGVFLWVAVSRLTRGHRASEIVASFGVPASLAATVATFAFYTPVILVSNGFDAVLRRRFTLPLSPIDVLSGLGGHLRQTAVELTSGIPRSVIVAVGLLVCLGTVRLARARQHSEALLLPSVVLGSLIVVFAMRRLPFARNWVFLIPIMAISADNGLMWLAARAGARAGQWVAPVAGSLAVFVVGWKLFAVATPVPEPISDSLPSMQAVACLFLSQASRNDAIVTEPGIEWRLSYYMRSLAHRKQGLAATFGCRSPGDRRLYLLARPSGRLYGALRDSLPDAREVWALPDLILCEYPQDEIPWAETLSGWVTVSDCGLSIRTIRGLPGMNGHEPTQ